MSYDLPWANLSNTPFRLFKRWVHEGGISTPFVIHWPDKISSHNVVNEPVQFADISPTILDICGSDYPNTYNGNEIIPVEGESFANLLKGQKFSKDSHYAGTEVIEPSELVIGSLFLSFQAWELYNIAEDRSETNNLVNRENCFDLEKKYEEWSKRCGVLDWPIRVDDKSTRKNYSMNKNEVGLDPNITPLEIEEERRYKRKPPNEDNITVRGMRYSK